MNSRHRFGLKAVFIGLLTAKIGVTVFYLAGTVSISEIFLRQQMAIAQDKEPQNAGNTPKKSDPVPKKKLPPPVDIRAVLKTLDDKKQRLKRKEEGLRKQQAQLETLKQEIEEKIENLSKIQQQIATDLEKRETMVSEKEQQKNAAEEAKIKRLVKVYTSMKPKKVAAIIDKMDIDIIHKIFSSMKGEQIGKILSYIERDRAVLISERLAEKDIQVPEQP